MQVSHRKTKSSKPQRHSNERTSVVLSGFDSAERGELKHFMARFPSLVVEEDMTFKVRLVISNTVWSSKYKAAAVLGLPVVNKQWVLDSFNQGKILPTENYNLGYFTGVRVGLFGYDLDEYQQIADLVIEQGGHVTKDVEDIVKQQKTMPTVIVVNRDKPEEYESIYTQFQDRTCDIEWIRQCKQRGRFVPYQHYLLKKILEGEIVDRDTIYDQLLQSSLEKSFDDYRLEDLTYFSGVVAFISCKEERIIVLAQRYITVADGFYLTEFCPIVTHVIVLDGRIDTSWQSCHVVNPLWLIESLMFRTRMVEADYRVYTKQLITKAPLVMEEQLPAPRQTGLFGLKRDIPFQPNLQLMNPMPVNRSLSFNQFSMPSEGKSNLFAGLQFYIYDHPRIPRSIKGLIMLHQGKAEFFSKNLPPTQNKTKLKTIILLPDSPETPSISKRLGQTIILSARWVTYCIEKRMVELDVVEKKLLTLQPLKYETPIPELQGKEIYINVSNLDDRVLFKEIVAILCGSYPAKFDPNTVTYFVSDKPKSKKLALLSRSQIKTVKWLIRLHQTGVE